VHRDPRFDVLRQTHVEGLIGAADHVHERHLTTMHWSGGKAQPFDSLALAQGRPFDSLALAKGRALRLADARSGIRLGGVEGLP
jgi:hypothetical protein